MPAPVLDPTLAIVAGLGALFVLAGALRAFVRLVGWLRAHAGQVPVGAFGLPDLLAALVLAGAFTALLINLALHPAVAAVPMEARQVLPSSLSFVIIVAGLAGFLRWRGLKLREIFGLRRLKLLPVVGWAAALLLAALPFLSVVNWLVVTWLKDPARQPLVELFRLVAATGDYQAMGQIGLAGVVLAPMCEEFLFRGFFYAVGKRYAGPWLSGLLCAALFAAFHANLAALPGLFVLAVFFTLAYERTGSLLVPITMHALFNATSLGLLYLEATGRLPA